MEEGGPGRVGVRVEGDIQPHRPGLLQLPKQGWPLLPVGLPATFRWEMCRAQPAFWQTSIASSAAFRSRSPSFRMWTTIMPP